MHLLQLWVEKYFPRMWHSNASQIKTQYISEHIRYHRIRTRLSWRDVCVLQVIVRSAASLVHEHVGAQHVHPTRQGRGEANVEQGILSWRVIVQHSSAFICLINMHALIALVLCRVLGRATLTVLHLYNSYVTFVLLRLNFYYAYSNALEWFLSRARPS